MKSRANAALSITATARHPFFPPLYRPLFGTFGLPEPTPRILLSLCPYDLSVRIPL